MILPELKRVVETGTISTGLKLRYALMCACMWAMPRRTRAEHVRAAEEERDEAWSRRPGHPTIF